MHSPEPSGDYFGLMRGKFSLGWEQVKSGWRDVGFDMEEVHDVLGELIVLLYHLTVN